LNQRILPTFDQYVGFSFEEAAREHLVRLARRGELSFLPERIGSWWNREGEIDVVAVSDSDRTLLVGECKWSDKPVGTNVLEDLKRKTRILLTTRKWKRVEYILFSKSGFTTDLQSQAKGEDVRLVKAPELTS
jgi:AAA+ ATPase superfamily predicted ATPase